MIIILKIRLLILRYFMVEIMFDVCLCKVLKNISIVKDSIIAIDVNC